MNFCLRSFLITMFVASASVGAKPVVVIDSQALILVNQEGLKKHVSTFSGIIDFVLNMSLNPIEEAERRFWDKLESNWGRQVGSDTAMVRDQDGQRVLPWIMVQWFKGDIAGQQAIDMVRAKCPSFVAEIAAVAFNAQLLADYSYTTPEALDLVAKCSRKADLFLVGNWNLEVFSRVAAKQQTLFQYIPVQHRYISGVMHLVLPCDIELICSLISRHEGIKIDDIIFVTSMPYHAQAAQRKGIKTILISNGNYQAAYAAVEVMVGS